jgi:hypothetical protein
LHTYTFNALPSADWNNGLGLHFTITEARSPPLRKVGLEIFPAAVQSSL